MFARDDLEARGFCGFLSIANLQKDLTLIDNKAGVYVVCAPEKPVEFQTADENEYLRSRHKRETLDELKENWVDDARVVYIGKAGGFKVRATLRSRLKSYFRYGKGRNSGHSGGRYLWQIADAQDLQVAWKTTPNEEPSVIESVMIAEFKALYGKRPFANHQD
jgi:hypothetical protein